MPEFTKGKWNFIEWPISSDKDEKQKYLIGSPERAIGFIFHEADAQLIAEAPEIYKLLEHVAFGTCDDCMTLMMKAREILARIDGREVGHEE